MYNAKKKTVENTPVKTGASPLETYLTRLGKNSRRVMRASPATACEELTGGPRNPEAFPWETLRFNDLLILKNKLLTRVSLASAKRIMSAVRGILKECWRLGLMDSDIFHRTVDIAPLRGQHISKGRRLTLKEQTALLSVCMEESTIKGHRDAALLAIMFCGGLRRTEVCNLNIGDFNQENGELLIRAGKGNKDRVVWIKNHAREAVLDWLYLMDRDQGSLFPQLHKGTILTDKRLRGGAASICF